VQLIHAHSISQLPATSPAGLLAVASGYLGWQAAIRASLEGDARDGDLDVNPPELALGHWNSHPSPAAPQLKMSNVGQVQRW
jgi:hypothetical protein